ncbi:hypothetical protein L195_g061239, partial [Trifolium pratense]
MNDEVSRLRGIGGKRRDKLALHGIKIGNIAEKSWKTIIAHVKECDVDDDEEEERVK